MKIAINLIPFCSVQGVEIFAQNIITNLLKIGKDNFLILMTEDSPDIFNFPEANIIRIKGLKGKIKKALWQQLKMPAWLKINKIDFLFCPSVQAPIFWKNKIVTIHDCAYDRFPEFDNLFSKVYFKMLFWGAKYFTKKIITVSNFSKKELIDIYKIKPEKIDVTYEGVPILPLSDTPIEKNILEKFKINKPYFLFIGNSRPRKNIVGLINAFNLFLKNTGKDYLLVIAGKIDKRFMDLEKEIGGTGLKKRILLTDFVAPEEKTVLYRSATALLFPSFYEGFGLPILEAQSLNIPILTSNTSSLPEIAGQGALLVNPYNIEEITLGINRITEDESLRNELIQKGLENIKKFSWQNSAEKLLETIHSL